MSDTQAPLVPKPFLEQEVTCHDLLDQNSLRQYKTNPAIIAIARDPNRVAVVQQIVTGLSRDDADQLFKSLNRCERLENMPKTVGQADQVLRNAYNVRVPVRVENIGMIIIIIIIIIKKKLNFKFNFFFSFRICVGRRRNWYWFALPRSAWSVGWHFE